MKGYKAFYKGYICRDFQYKIGETYEIEGELKICQNGFHFCENLIDVFGYYSFDKDNVVLAEVEALGDILQEGTKFCTNKIKIIKAVDWTEIENILHDENHNSGYSNSGSYNSGSGNSGSYNSGSGNSGYYNSGNWNSGSGNSGNWNSGNLNNGNCNSGSWNNGSHNSGFFNTNEPTVRLFNKDSSMTFSQFYNLGIDFTNLEDSRKIIENLPNYNAQIFYEITGLDWRTKKNGTTKLSKLWSRIRNRQK